jgi:hypothetical protein
MSRKQVEDAINEILKLHQEETGESNTYGGGRRKGVRALARGYGLVAAPAPFGYGGNIAGCNMMGQGNIGGACRKYPPGTVQYAKQYNQDLNAFYTNPQTRSQDKKNEIIRAVQAGSLPEYIAEYMLNKINTGQRNKWVHLRGPERKTYDRKGCPPGYTNYSKKR